MSAVRRGRAGASQEVSQSVIQHGEHQCRLAQNRPSRKVVVGNACEGIEALGPAGDRLGDELAGNPGRRGLDRLRQPDSGLRARGS